MTPETTYRSSIRWSFAGSAGATLFQFLQMLVFARLAGAEAAGDYVLAATVVGFLAPLAEPGLGQAVVQARDLRREHVAALTWVGFIFGSIVFLFVWAGSDWVAAWYARPALAGLLPLMGVSLLLTPFGAQHSGLLVRDMRFDATARIEVAAAAASLCAVTVLAFAGWGVWAMAWGFLVRNILTTLGNWWAARRILPLRADSFSRRFRRFSQINLTKNLRKSAKSAGDKPLINREKEVGDKEAASFKTTLREIRPMLRFGVFDLGARWVDFLANYLDKLIIGKWLGAGELGYYHIAFTLCVLPTARIGTVVTRVTFPVFAKMQQQHVQLQAFFQRAAQEVTLLLFPVYAGLALFARELITLLYGHDWLPATPLLTIFAIAGLVRTLNAVFPHLTKGIGKPQLSFSWMLIWTAVLLVFLYVFLSIAPNVESAAWSRVAAKYMVEIALLFWLARQCGVDFAPVWRYALRLGAYLAPVVLAVVATDWLVDGFWPAFALKLPVFGIGLVWVARVFRGDLRGLAGTFRQKER